LPLHIHPIDVHAPLIIKILLRLYPEMLDILWRKKMDNFVLSGSFYWRFVLRDDLKACMKGILLFSK
jgi:hypothetical protein